MGRNASGRAESPLEAGLDLYRFEIEHMGSNHEDALVTAINAAVSTAHRCFTRGTRDDILEKAEDLDDDETNDLNDDGPAALLWYAKLLDETLPHEQRLENQ